MLILSIILIDKILGTGEVALEDHRSSQPTYEEFKKVVAETSIGGMLAGKAGIVNIHMGDGKNGSDRNCDILVFLQHGSCE